MDTFCPNCLGKNVFKLHKEDTYYCANCQYKKPVKEWKKEVLKLELRKEEIKPEEFEENAKDFTTYEILNYDHKIKISNKDEDYTEDECDGRIAQNEANHEMFEKEDDENNES